MTTLRLAWRNLAGAGVRTWLNAVVLSLVFLSILTAQALLKGMYLQTERAMIASEYGGGQYSVPAYDRYDPLTISSAHGPVPGPLRALIQEGRAAELLLVTGSIYAGGRMQPVMMRGVDPGQAITDVPVAVLAEPSVEIPVVLGARMSQTTGLEPGDLCTLQWRDRHGTFDARRARVVDVFRTQVQSIDRGQLWLPLETLRAMVEMPGESTLVTVAPGTAALEAEGWSHHGLEELLADIRALVRSKMTGSLFVYAVLVFLAMLAIFDTRVFAIFKRQREIGTLVALGMTRAQVARLFTLEGIVNAFLALGLAAVYGWPLLGWFARSGWHLPETTDAYGYALGEVLYPVYAPEVIFPTAGIILLLAAIVSYLPTRRITSVAPTDALRGRVF